MKTRHIVSVPPQLTHLFARGAIGLILSLGLALLLLQVAIAFAVAILVSCIFILSFIYMRLRRPRVALSLTPMHIQLHHPAGGYAVRWRDIQAIEQLSLEKEGWHQPLPWVSIKLNNTDRLLQSICPRLASRLMIEQRVLLVMAYKSGRRGQVPIEDMLFDDTPYTTNGITYTGLMAIFANRLKYNRELLGGELLISEELSGMECTELVGLARRYLAASER
ncbi:DUF2982 domain-containing protein [Thaumasiovibrio sp. DFM-14]|uniref:DUF2982 domain-containing protein n=1 Tax=Thaumasiovibrio sp. DFM-14 TaxID=3384792 RepID=UPI00399FBB1C